MGQSPKPEYTPFSIPFWKKAGLGVVFSRKSPYHKTKGRMVDKTMDYTAGIDVGGTKVALGVFGEDKTLLGKAKYPSDPALSAQDFFRQTVDTLRQLMEGLSLPWENLKGVGVGVPSLVRYPEGSVVLCAALPNLNGFGVKAFLQQLLPGVAVEVDNDAHCAALAESRQGAGVGRPHMLYCPVSTGLSSAIIIHGQLFRGNNGFAGESGHTVLTPGQGLPCGCGNQGCAQSYSSGGMIVQHIRQWIAQGEPTLMVDLAGSPEKIDARHIEQAARAGDPMALRALDQMALYLGVWVFNLYMTLNIDCFVFGGGLTKMGPLLFDRVRKAFDSFCHTEEPVEFLFAQCGQDVGILGAAELLF